MFNNEDNNFKNPEGPKVVMIGGRGSIGKSMHLTLLALGMGSMAQSVQLVARENSKKLDKISDEMNQIPRNMKNIPVLIPKTFEGRYFTPPLNRKERREQERKINKRKR